MITKKIIKIFQRYMDARFPLIFGGQIVIFLLIKFFQHNYHVLNWRIDTKIPFIPEFIYLYLFFFVYMVVCYSYLFVQDRNGYCCACRIAIIGAVITYIVFVCYPTEMVDERNLCNADAFTRWLCLVTFAADYPAINCFPSLHCVDTFIVVYAICASKNTQLWIKCLVVAVSMLIVLSILFTKQHYVVDIMGASFVFLIAVYINKILWDLVFPMSQTRSLISNIFLNGNYNTNPYFLISFLISSDNVG